MIEVSGSTQSRRFNLVKNADALITVKGKGNTQSVIELALAINKPVLPIAFTGGDSKKMWDMYEEDITKLLVLPEELKKQLDHLPSTNESIKKSGETFADFIKESAKKVCLVLMPFKQSNDQFYDDCLKKAIINSKFSHLRIDRDEPAGNIPDLFRTNLEKAKAVIVDITGYNANVMYELGHVHSKNIKPLIIHRNTPGNTIDIGALPFYLKHEMIVKENDDKEGHEKIRLAVENFLAFYS